MKENTTEFDGAIDRHIMCEPVYFEDEGDDNEPVCPVCDGYEYCEYCNNNQKEE